MSKSDYKSELEDEVEITNTNIITKYKSVSIKSEEINPILNPMNKILKISSLNNPLNPIQSFKSKGLPNTMESPEKNSFNKSKSNRSDKKTNNSASRQNSNIKEEFSNEIFKSESSNENDSTNNLKKLISSSVDKTLLKKKTFKKVDKNKEIFDKYTAKTNTDLLNKFVEESKLEGEETKKRSTGSKASKRSKMSTRSKRAGGGMNNLIVKGMQDKMEGIQSKIDEI